MEFRQLTDWDTACDNVGHVPGASDFPNRWQQLAQQFRDDADYELNIAYGQSSREVFDLLQT